jgi:Zn-finger nucleic acid-binding protein
MKCPVCQVELKIAERAGIEIDYCPNCRGIWLDRGELDKIIERYALSSEQADAPPAKPSPSPHHHRPAPPPPPYDEDDKPHPRRRHHKRRKKNWLEELFDIFD